MYVFSLLKTYGSGGSWMCCKPAQASAEPCSCFWRSKEN